MQSGKPAIAIATGDPAGIGPEVALKAALDPKVRSACNALVVSDPALLRRHAEACGIAAELHPVERVADADWSGSHVNVLACPQPDLAALPFGVTSPTAGRAALAFASRAIKVALAGEIDAVVAAPQNETSIAQAGIAFDGYPSFVARETGADPDRVYLMLCFGERKIAHVTLHRSVTDALALITHDNVACAIRGTDAALRRLGVARPKICVSGLNPHAGESGLFGREEIDVITPAIEAAAAEGIAASGPFGADTMLLMMDVDAFVVMLHDQGHIPAKLMAPNATAAMTIGTPILFSSVAHGSAHDIAGKGIASAAAMIEAVLRLATTQRNA